MDLEIAKFLNNLGLDTFLDSFTQTISNTTLLTLLWLLIAFTILIFDKKNGKKIFIALLIATFLHFLISEGIFKILIEDLRTRPYIGNSEFIKAVGNKLYEDSSFPSSHMSSTTGILTVLGYFYRKAIIPAIIFILFMGFARIHNGMHYPTDVLAGIVLGIIYGTAGIYISTRTKIGNPS